MKEAGEKPKEKKPEKIIFYDFIYMNYPKRQVYRDRKYISGHLGLQGLGLGHRYKKKNDDLCLFKALRILEWKKLHKVFSIASHFASKKAEVTFI